MVPAPYSAMTVVPCEKAIGLACASEAVPASMQPANAIRNRFMGTLQRRSAMRSTIRPRLWMVQAIGGGLRGGSHRVLAGSTSSVSAVACEGVTATMNELGVMAAASVHITRQSFIELVPSGQQGQ